MTTTSTINAAEGERRKIRAHSLLEVRRETLIRRARRAMLIALIQDGEATIDDVRKFVPLPDGVNPKVFGAVPGVLAEAGIIKADGVVKSRRPEAHARPVQRWRLADRAAARAWLADHPDLPDPQPHQVNLFDTTPIKSPALQTPGSETGNNL